MSWWSDLSKEIRLIFIVILALMVIGFGAVAYGALNSGPSVGDRYCRADGSLYEVTGNDYDLLVGFC